eukprot:GILK01000927.1.p1 GENE.GILK01000927.1~~GILK01000927.1.p1  ORF type:complete len:299 (-),score=19.01 GILK01000927.1:156-1013(-)
MADLRFVFAAIFCCICLSAFADEGAMLTRPPPRGKTTFTNQTVSPCGGTPRGLSTHSLNKPSSNMIVDWTINTAETGKCRIAVSNATSDDTFSTWAKVLTPETISLDSEGYFPCGDVAGDFNVTVKLPAFVCSFCIFQWIRKADSGDIWYNCGDIHMEAECEPECQNNGLCQEDKTCLCSDGFSGALCQTAPEADSNAGMIVGIVFGVLFGIVLCAGCCFFMCGTPAGGKLLRGIVNKLRGSGPAKPARLNEVPLNTQQPQFSYGSGNLPGYGLPNYARDSTSRI